MPRYAAFMVKNPAARLLACLTILGGGSSIMSAASAATPAVLRCHRISVTGCTPDGICIADKLIDNFSITFAMKAKRYKSAVGTGRIHDQWELPDGRHAIMAISPPAFAEFTFSSDWRSASDGRGVGYSCTTMKG